MPNEKHEDSKKDNTRTSKPSTSKSVAFEETQINVINYGTYIDNDKKNSPLSQPDTLLFIDNDNKNRPITQPDNNHQISQRKHKNFKVSDKNNDDTITIDYANVFSDKMNENMNNEDLALYADNIDYFNQYKMWRNNSVGLTGTYKSVDRKSAGEVSRVVLVPIQQKSKPFKYDFVQLPDYERVQLQCTILWMQILGITHLALMFAYSMNDNFAERGFEDIGSYWSPFSHFFLGSLLIYTCGNAIILFRVFTKTKVRNIKYFHLLLHTLAFVFAILSLYAFYRRWAGFDSGNHNYSIHSKLGILTVIGYAFQYFIGFSIYTTSIANQTLRMQFYHYHSYMGFVMFFLTIVLMVTGLTADEKFFELGYTNNFFVYSVVAKLIALTGIMFAGCVLFIIIYPYFDFSKENELI